MKTKYLIVDTRDLDWKEQMSLYGVDLLPPYRSIPFFLKIIRELNRCLNYYIKLPMLRYWFNPEVERKLNTYSHVIVFIQKKSFDVLSFLSSRKSDSQRLIAWYWNPAYRVMNPHLLKRFKCEGWSFDEEDCIKYNMKYNTTFFLFAPKEELIKRELKGDSEKYDILFLGANKGRIQLLNKLQAKLVSMGVKFLFYVVDEEQKSSLRKPVVSYHTYLKWLCQTIAVLDIVQANQRGLTLRVMESLFYKKKLVTNNLYIKEYDFYNPNNIFILGVDNLDMFIDFLKSPYLEVKEETITRYSFKEWIKRFK